MSSRCCQKRGVFKKRPLILLKAVFGIQLILLYCGMFPLGVLSRKLCVLMGFMMGDFAIAIPSQLSQLPVNLEF